MERPEPRDIDNVLDCNSRVHTKTTGTTEGRPDRDTAETTAARGRLGLLERSRRCAGEVSSEGIRQATDGAVEAKDEKVEGGSALVGREDCGVCGRSLSEGSGAALCCDHRAHSTLSTLACSLRRSDDFLVQPEAHPPRRRRGTHHTSPYSLHCTSTLRQVGSAYRPPAHTCALWKQHFVRRRGDRDAMMDGRALPQPPTPHFPACVLAAGGVIPSHSTHQKKSASVCRSSCCPAFTMANSLPESAPRTAPV